MKYLWISFRRYIVFIISFVVIFCAVASPVLAANLDDGAAIFEANCAGCHPKGGNILRRGKTLKQKALKRNHVDTLDEVIALVTNGKNNMSAYGDRLTKEEIKTVSNYVLEQATKNWR